jgi:hypothetical protein
MAGVHIAFQFETRDDEDRFLREYLADAWERFEASEFFETGWFWRFGQFNEHIDHDSGGVSLVFDGDPDALIETEEERWLNFAGLDSWELHRYENPDALRGGGWDTDTEYDSVLEEQMARKGERGGEWQYRLLPLAARFSLDYLREFDDPLPAVADESEENLTGVGFWTHLHYEMIQCGYDWYDETDACLKGMKFRVKTLASDLDPAAAREEYNRLKDEWEAYEDALEEWLAEHPDDEAEEL